jgi:hypothetical protein
VFLSLKNWFCQVFYRCYQAAWHHKLQPHELTQHEIFLKVRWTGEATSKDIAEMTNLDISLKSRVANSKSSKQTELNLSA